MQIIQQETTYVKRVLEVSATKKVTGKNIKMFTKHTSANIECNYIFQQIKEEPEVVDESRSNFCCIDSLTYDHSNSQRLFNTNELNRQEVYHPSSKEQENNQNIKDNECTVKKEIADEYDIKINVEYNPLDENGFQGFGEELCKPKNEIIESATETHDTLNQLEGFGKSSNLETKSYKCTVCLQSLNLEQSLKIHMVVYKGKKYVFCEDCFICFARKRNHLGQTSISNGFLRKRILRKDLDSHITSGDNKLDKG